MAGRKYIVGTEDHLAVSSEEPLVCDWPLQDGKVTKASFKTTHGNRSHFTVLRGRCQEYKSYATGKHVYCRVLPPDAETELGTLDAYVRACEEKLESARAERQEFLRANAARGQHVRVKKSAAGKPETAP